MQYAPSGFGVARGPSRRCVQLVFDSELQLFVSPAVMEELRDVTSRPRVVAKLHLIQDRVDEFLEDIEVAATLLEGFPESFSYARDPHDAHYVSLAIAAGADLIISRDRDLLDLMTSTSADAVGLRARFPSLRILDPVALLNEVEERH